MNRGHCYNIKYPVSTFYCSRALRCYKDELRLLSIPITHLLTCQNSWIPFLNVMQAPPRTTRLFQDGWYLDVPRSIKLSSPVSSTSALLIHITSATRNDDSGAEAWSSVILELCSLTFPTRSRQWRVASLSRCCFFFSLQQSLQLGLHLTIIALQGCLQTSLPCFLILYPTLAISLDFCDMGLGTIK